MQIHSISSNYQPSNNTNFKQNNHNTSANNMKLLAGATSFATVAVSAAAIYKSKNAKNEIRNLAEKLKNAETKLNDADIKLQTIQDKLDIQTKNLTDSIKENDKLKEDLKKKPPYRTIIIHDTAPAENEVVSETVNKNKKSFTNTKKQIKEFIETTKTKLGNIFTRKAKSVENSKIKENVTETPKEKKPNKIKKFFSDSWQKLKTKYAEQKEAYKKWEQENAERIAQQNKENEKKIEGNSTVKINEVAEEKIKDTKIKTTNTDSATNEMISETNAKEVSENITDNTSNEIKEEKPQGEIKAYFSQKWTSIKNTLSQMYRYFKESLKPIPGTIQETTPTVNETKNEAAAIIEQASSETISHTEETQTKSFKSKIKNLMQKVKSKFTPKKTEKTTHFQDDGMLPPLKQEEEPPKWVQKINNFIEWLFRPENEDF